MSYIEKHALGSPEREVVAFSNDQPFGISIVGMGQAGKTTLRNGITEAWRRDLDPEATIVHFSNSDGFRGLTADIIGYAGIPVTETVDESKAKDAIDSFIEQLGICTEQLNDYYHKPKPNVVWRTNAVNTMVAYVSEHPVIRPMINRAGSRFMKEIIEDPAIMKLDKSPDLFVLDARNIPECTEKFTGAQVKPVGSFILICDEVTVVRRVTDDSGLSTAERIRNLVERNKHDSIRELAPMSLPKDFDHTVEIADAVRERNIAKLYSYGREVAADPCNIPIILDTSDTSPEQTMAAMPFLLSGLISSVTAINR
jgi:cytidylate kinase